LKNTYKGLKQEAWYPEKQVEMRLKNTYKGLKPLYVG